MIQFAEEQFPFEANFAWRVPIQLGVWQCFEPCNEVAVVECRFAVIVASDFPSVAFERTMVDAHQRAYTQHYLHTQEQ